MSRYSSICSIGSGQLVLSDPRRRILGSMHVLGPPLPPVGATLSRPPSNWVNQKNTHRAHVDRFQIIQVSIIRLFGVVWIELACNLDELLPEVREKPSRRDYKWTICAMSGPPSRNLVRLDLLTLNRRASGARTLLTHLFQ